jgi:hypothetical protein
MIGMEIKAQPGYDRRAVPGTDSIEVKSYHYLRISLVALVAFLAAAVAYQTVLQGSFLASVSAYYYTPAQAVFVGALIAVGVCMIALEGSPVEDVFLNLGGMLAAVVAIVPTSRGKDFESAVRACKQADGPMLTSPAPDCPTVRALVAATRANVENNMLALLAVGALGIAATVLFAWLHRSRRRRDPRPALGKKFWWGMGAAACVYLLAAASFLTSTEWFIDHAHIIAAYGVFTSIVVVVLINAIRSNDHRYRYIAIAAIMVAVALVGVPLVMFDVIALLWLETAIITLFAVYWVFQTFEHWDG